MSPVEAQGEFSVVIPARYASTRLPGKPLADIAGEPMVVRVCENAQRSGAQLIVVATDDERVVAAVTARGYRALMTAATHNSGTERLAEVAELLELPESSVVVNVQGDEPLLEPELIRLVARVLADVPRAGVATVASTAISREEIFNPNVCKVVVNRDGFAQYFSRAPIPWLRDHFASDEGRNQPLPAGMHALRHIGLYAYRVATLRQLAAAPPAMAEQAEVLEQLRALWLGIPIHVSVVDVGPSLGVDTEDDLSKVRALYLARAEEGRVKRPES